MKDGLVYWVELIRVELFFYVEPMTSDFSSRLSSRAVGSRHVI